MPNAIAMREPAFPMDSTDKAIPQSLASEALKKILKK
jgi:hypothetical protein